MRNYKYILLLLVLFTPTSFAINQIWNIDKVGVIQNIEENTVQNIEIKKEYYKTINEHKIKVYVDNDNREYFQIKGGYVDIKNIENNNK